jgi:predicted trehalose synthase
MVQKIFYEVGYEAANRPHWLRIPLAGIRDLFGNERRQEGETSGSTG